MSFAIAVVSAILAFSAIVYLVYALVNPEKF